jgi:hypothetical protein
MTEAFASTRQQITFNPAAGRDAKVVSERLASAAMGSPTRPLLMRLPTHVQVREEDLSEALFDARAAFKIMISQIAMHLSDEWRTALFERIDGLLSAEEWDADDKVPSTASFQSLLRFVLLACPARLPALGATFDGHFVASWNNGADYLTIEFLPEDRLKWSVSTGPADNRERAAGVTTLSRAGEVLAPYRPRRWFEHGVAVP